MINNNTKENNSVIWPYAWWDGAFSDDEIDKIITLCEIKEKEKAGLLSQNNNPDFINSVRRCNLSFHRPDQNNAWIFEKLNSVISNINDQFYGFRLNGYDYFQYTTYNAEEQGMYDWHIDTVLGSKNLPENMFEPRKLSITFLLSDPSEFEGGEFQINVGSDEEKETIEMKRGRIIAFPSFIMHRVAPVTKGIRKSLVVWVTGPKFV